MQKCTVCGAVAEYSITQYNSGVQVGVSKMYCHDDGLEFMLSDTGKTYGIMAQAHVYKPLKAKLNDKRGGYVR